MKTTLTIALATAALALSLPRQAGAQNVNVVNAYNHMKAGELAKAAEFIEPAISDAKTGASEKTWRYRGDIYRLIASSEDQALRSMFPDALDKAIDSYLKANELDVKGSYKIENVKALGALQGMSLNAGNEAFTGKSYDRAIVLYGNSERIAKAFGQVDTNAIFNKALAYESKGDGANAIKHYREVLALGYDKPEVYRYIASLQRKGGDADGAIATTKEGMARYPDNKDLILDLMSDLLNADRSDDAEQIVKLALEKDPENAVLHSVEGGLFDKKANAAMEANDEAGMKQWSERAEAAYKKSIEKDAKFFDAYFNIGVLYNNRAAFEYEKCNKIKSDSEYMKCKKLADDVYLMAKPYFEKAHELRPDDKQTINQLMKLYAKVNDQAKYKEMKDKLTN
ncbi:MAG: tetratricopeptide repeat protein [Flavobacteriales bacterium]|nr:tetratricopeptide repeat protein [Flavobacteriales bacterium]